MKLKPFSPPALTLLVGTVALVATTIFADQLAERKSDDEVTAKLVCELISQYHISREPVDEKICGRLVENFLKQLDPQKQYFLQSDVDELNKHRDKLHAQLKEGNVEFAFTAFNRYLKRLDERIKLADELIDAEHDFDVEETMVIDNDKRAWAKTEAEIRERWRKRIKYDLLLFKLDGKPVDEARERLHRRYHMIEKTMKDTERHEQLEMYLSTLAQCFDPHSSYMSPETLEDFRIIMSLSLEGIGASLRSEDGYTTVMEIIPGGAASKDGRLKPGDKIIGVGQETGEIVDVVEMKLSKVVRFIRGKAGTKVRLQVKTGDTNEVKIYELERQKIELKSSEVAGEIIKTEKRIEGRKGRVGVIRIPSFYRDFTGAQKGTENFKSTARDVMKVLLDFRDQGGVDGIIIDLRNNGGGSLTEAIDVSGLFIDRGPVVQVKDQNGRVKSLEDEDPGLAYTGPLVVVCDRRSASASEIFAGVIKDYKRGIVVGDQTTHGKGTVQNVMPVSKQMFQLFNPQDRGALKLTINQFYRVNGDSTQNEGVPSDIVLPSVLDHLDYGEAFLDNSLGFDQIPPAEHDTFGAVTPEMISTLQKASQKRVENCEEFQKVRKDIEKLIERKNRKAVSLNEAERRREREEGDAKAKAEEQALEDPDAEGPVFASDFYNDEILNITLDYIPLVNGMKTAKN